MESKGIMWVSSADSLEFAYCCWSVTHSSIIALDTEWILQRIPHSFPSVSLLQIACRNANSDDSITGSPVFLVDLLSIHLPSIYDVLKDALVSPNILKLGFRFKQDLMCLSSTFSSNGCDHGFDRVEPYMDAMSLYNHVQHTQSIGMEVQKDSKSLASICKELLGISLSKEFQCSDWSKRPLSEEQKAYAAADAQCLLDIFDVFKAKMDKEGQQPLLDAIDSDMMLGNTKEMDPNLKHMSIITCMDKILLNADDRKPKGNKKKRRKKFSCWNDDGASKAQES